MSKEKKLFNGKIMTPAQGRIRMRDAEGLGFLRQGGELSGESSKVRPGYFGQRVRPSDFLPRFLPSRDSTYLAGWGSGIGKPTSPDSIMYGSRSVCLPFGIDVMREKYVEITDPFSMIDDLCGRPADVSFQSLRQSAEEPL